MNDEEELALENFLENVIENHIDTDSSFEGLMFETYDEEMAFVLEMAKENRVATYVDSDGTRGGTAIESGLHYCNRIGYFITKEPITEDFVLQVSYDDDTFENESEEFIKAVTE